MLDTYNLTSQRNKGIIFHVDIIRKEKDREPPRKKKKIDPDDVPKREL